MHLYPNYDYVLFVNSLPVAGFSSLVRVGQRSLLLRDGFTYDRPWLLWATNWRSGVYWLPYALFWLRVRKELEIKSKNGNDEPRDYCQVRYGRPKKLVLGYMLSDGGFLIDTLELKGLFAINGAAPGQRNVKWDNNHVFCDDQVKY